MTPERRAQSAYEEWLTRVPEEVRQAAEGSRSRELFVEIVAATIADAQETVALGTGFAETPVAPRA